MDVQISKKRKVIKNFLDELREQSALDVKLIDPDNTTGDVLKHFAVLCRKCGSARIFVSWEEGIDWGGFTGYSAGQKLFKCQDCGNAASFWE